MVAVDDSEDSSEQVFDFGSSQDRKLVVRAAGTLIAAVVVAALYFASEVLIPITLAGLLTFILTPLVNLLRRGYIPRVPASVAAVVLALGIIVGIGTVIGSQVADLAGQLPSYETSIQAKLTRLREVTFAPLAHAIARFQAHPGQSSDAQESSNGSEGTAAQPKPVPVQVQQAPLTPLQVGEKFIAPILHPLATLVIMLVVTLFALLYRQDLRDRAIRLLGSGDLSRTTSTIDDAARRLSKYFITQLAINSAFGIVVAVGTYLIGLPHPILWGVLGGVLRFVPYIGAWLAAGLPILLAAAVDPGWSMVVLTAALYATTEFIAGQILEPLLYGHSTGLSPVAVVISAIFWTWVWGPIGLIISTPLTLCVVVIGRHFEQLSFFDVLFGSRPALRPSETLYQRLLAGDLDEAEEQLEQFAKEHGLAEFYDNVAIEALQLASHEFRSNTLPPARAAKLRRTFEHLAELAFALPPGEHDSSPATAPEVAPDAQILCLPGRGPFDHLATVMLAQLFKRSGIEASTSLHEAASRRKVGSLELKNIAAVCVLYLEISGAPANVRFLIRRLKQRNPDTKIVLGLLQQEAMASPEDLAPIGADEYASSLQGALDSAKKVIQSRASAIDAQSSRPKALLVESKN
jgi:predicted PurR-regulated permease PerM